MVLPSLLLLTALHAASLPAPGEATVYVEAERFASVGGWTVDAQFRAQMGSTYLLAAGIGVPVADAVTPVDLPRAGSYRLWVRCKDWDPTSPGAFQVLLNGQAAPVTFGTQQRDWAWIDGGAHRLPAGAVTVALHDLTGYYGRCDALVLTTDQAFRPADDVAAVTALREAVLGRPAVQELAFEFVVVGGGYGGVCAAVQAARLGVKTALIQNRPVLGGNASQEINVGPGGASPHTSPFRETGVVEAIAEGRYQGGSRSLSDAIALLVKETANLTVYLNTEGVGVEQNPPGHLAAVNAEQVITGARYRFTAPLFADCTGDGALAFALGCPFRVGEEARSEYHESHAPEQASPHTMGTSLLHGSSRRPTPQPYTPPPFAVKFTAEHFQHRTESLQGGQWWIEYGGLKDTIGDAEHIRDELLRVVFGAFDWAKNQDPKTKDKLANFQLTHVPTVGGKRESRRFISDFVLTQNDVEAATLFADRVAFGGWPIDLHPASGIYGKEIPPYTPFGLQQPYSIPYRILYPKGCDNLFLAGRHVSVSHVALGSTRLMQTIGTMGQAVGAAAWYCRRYGCGPRGLSPEHIGELQQTLLKWDAYLLGLTNTDAADLCRGAKVAASSESRAAVSVLAADAPRGKPAPLTMARGLAVAATQPGCRRVEVLLANSGAQPQPVTLHLARGAFGPQPEPLAKVTAAAPPGAARWVTFELPIELAVDQPYGLWLEPAPDVAMTIGDAAGERFWGRPGAWTRSGGVYLTRPRAMIGQLGNLSASAAVDGLKWPLPDGGHQWRSDRAQGLPQWLEVDLGGPHELNTVYLTWDTDLFGRSPSPQPGTSCTATHYRVLAHVGDQWRVVAEEPANWRRFRRHTFAAVTADRLKIEVLAARNGQEARLYEVRAYRE